MIVRIGFYCSFPKRRLQFCILYIFRSHWWYIAYKIYDPTNLVLQTLQEIRCYLNPVEAAALTVEFFYDRSAVYQILTEVRVQALAAKRKKKQKVELWLSRLECFHLAFEVTFYLFFPDEYIIAIYANAWKNHKRKFHGLFYCYSFNVSFPKM